MSRLTGPDGVLPEALRLAAGPTLAYAEAKRAIQAARCPPGRRLAAEAQAQARLGFTADHRDAVQAFLAKRPRSSTATDPASGRQSPCAHICG